MTQEPEAAALRHKEALVTVYHNAENFGSTKLIIAMTLGWYGCVTRLIREDRGSKLMQASDLFGDSPASILCATRDIDLVCAVVAGQPAWPTQCSPFHWLIMLAGGGAADSQQLAVAGCRKLMEAGARPLINARNYNGFTPLMRAVRASARHLALALIEAGADCGALTPRFVYSSSGAPGAWLPGGLACKPRDFKPPIFLCLVRMDFELARAMVKASTRVLDQTWIGRDAGGGDWEREVFEYALHTAKCFRPFLDSVIDIMTGTQLLRAWDVWTPVSCEEALEKVTVFSTQLATDGGEIRRSRDSLRTLARSCALLEAAATTPADLPLIFPQSAHALYDSDFPTDECGVDLDPESRPGF